MQYEVTAEIIINPEFLSPHTSTECTLLYNEMVLCYQRGCITSFKNGRFRHLSPDRFLKDLQRAINNSSKLTLRRDERGGIRVDWKLICCTSGAEYLTNRGFIKDGEYTGKKVSKKDLRFAFINSSWIRYLLTEAHK